VGRNSLNAVAMLQDRKLVLAISMAHLSVSKEFGLNNKKIAQDLCQLKLKSLDDLLNSSSSSDEDDEEEENESEEDEGRENERDEDNGEKREEDVIKEEKAAEPSLPDFIYGPLRTSECPEELCKIFQSKGQPLSSTFLIIIIRPRGHLLDLPSSISSPMAWADNEINSSGSNLLTLSNPLHRI
jgi:hypothetical protein